MWKNYVSYTWNLNKVKKVLSLKSGIFKESWAYPPCGWFLIEKEEVYLHPLGLGTSTLYTILNSFLKVIW